MFGYFSARSIARRLLSTEVPIVMIRVTPASVARRSTSSKSFAKSGQSRCACVSINISCAKGKNSPFDDGTGPSESTAKHNHQNVIAVFDPTAAICFIQGDGDSSRGSVPILVEINVEAIERNF